MWNTKFMDGVNKCEILDDKTPMTTILSQTAFNGSFDFMTFVNQLSIDQSLLVIVLCSVNSNTIIYPSYR